MTRTVDVLLPLPIDQLFSYAFEEDTEVSIGDYVLVPFGRKRLIGIVWRESSKSGRELKFIEQKVDLPRIRPKLIEFAEWVAQYNVIPIGMLAKVIMGGILKINQIDKLVCTKQKQEISEIDYQLNPEQQAALDKIISNLNEYSVTLLDGETGSGKTEVYLSVIAQLIKNHSIYEHCDLGLRVRRHSSAQALGSSFSYNLITNVYFNLRPTPNLESKFLDSSVKHWNDTFAFKAKSSVTFSILFLPRTGMTPFAMQFTFKNKRYVIPAFNTQLYECYNIRVIFTNKDVIPVHRHWDPENLISNQYTKQLYDKDWIPVSRTGMTSSTTKTTCKCSNTKRLHIGMTPEEGDVQVLILLPEIVLTSQLVNRVCSQTSGNIAEWHSGLTPKARRNNWLSIANGSAQIIIGARSALFLPCKNLKLIIVDEEHDSSFKQEQGIIYNARDMAIILAKLENIPIILSSATPLLETIYHVKKGNYNHVKLTERFGGAELPHIKVVNNKQWISNELFEGIKQTIEKKQQVMLFLNRRGYAQLAVCKKCGYKISCSNCTVWLTYHKKKNVLLCHHCSYQSKLPEKCSTCQSEQSLILYGVGIERLVEEIVKLIPNAKTAIISSDQKSLGSVIDSVLKEEVNIIIGTQVIAKGHNFPKLTLVGVINADLGLENSDLRAAEKTYQLLHQVAGRSGRFNEKGTVIVQTNNPESLIIKALQQQKRDLFYEVELESRRKAKMPPFSRLIALIVCGKDQFATQKAASEITSFLHDQCSATIPSALSFQCMTRKEELEIFGPSPAVINFLNNKYRYRVLLKIHSKHSLFIKKKLKHWIKNYNSSSNITVTIDVDPVSFF
ncbi:replication restart helicase PriA [Wolbachia endosymbiont of Trichogramma pretiosum]|uniref:replication restart helicase PriA n=1 Tax=Wolbachia endosymbiont of Trichogramma pretiosum TaxID=125593 RepID=UPI000839A7F2|nr:primosomal protein N' [Wolbachia endosymbiont of Trichogramma pretiosum]OCA06582.1 primosomal protein N' [Wolbachia endosymbiont of Trichogramma pretiosum]